jgi:hypothetical protein
MKYFIYLLILMLISPVLIGGTMITTMHSYRFVYDTKYNENIDNPSMSMVSFQVEATEIEESKIKFIYDTITYSSPYICKWILHSKFKDFEIIRSYILLNGKEKIVLNINLLSNGEYKDSYVFKTEEQSIEIDVNETDYIDIILEYKVNANVIKSEYRYNLEYKKETGNRLWWSIMSV